MSEDDVQSFKTGAVMVLASVVLMIGGFALAAFSTIYVFAQGPTLPALVAVLVAGFFLLFSFTNHFPRMKDGWTPLLVFTVGTYALCLSPIPIMHILAFMLGR